jgi:putative membrane protein
MELSFKLINRQLKMGQIKTKNNITDKYGGITKIAFYILLGFFVFAGISCDHDNEVSATGFSDDADDFIIRAGYFNAAEIEFSKVAINRAQDERVKAFAQKLYDEHTAAQNELIELGAKKGLYVPQGLSERDIETLEDLQEKKADKFDEFFTDQQESYLKIHEDDYKDEADDADDQDVKNYAAKYYPVIAANQNTAGDLEDEVD